MALSRPVAGGGKRHVRLLSWHLSETPPAGGQNVAKCLYFLASLLQTVVEILGVKPANKRRQKSGKKIPNVDVDRGARSD